MRVDALGEAMVEALALVYFVSLVALIFFMYL